jgi:glycosyltransferase involved in cell wall biosynthesis
VRILFSTHHVQDPDTGASGTALALGEAYRELGHEVSTLSFDDLPKMPGRAAGLLYPYRVAERLGLPRKSDLDVIDASTGDTWLWGMLPRRGPAPLLVTRSHGLDQLRYRATLEYEARHGRRPSLQHRLYAGHWRLAEVGRSLRQADLVLALNADERLFAIDELGIDPDRLALIGNPVPEAILTAGATVNREPGARDIAYVGAYREMKGMEYGIAAMVEVLEESPEVTMSFIGVGSGATAKIMDAFPGALRDRVRIVPEYQRGALPGLLEGRGILIFPSLSEGFGNVMVEAMACGLAPVASATGGAKQIVERGVNGLLVPRYSAPELASAVKLLLRDPDLRGRLQVEARASASRYSIATVAERTLDAYRSGLERRRSELRR